MMHMYSVLKRNTLPSAKWAQRRRCMQNWLTRCSSSQLLCAVLAPAASCATNFENIIIMKSFLRKCSLIENGFPDTFDVVLNTNNIEGNLLLTKLY